MIHQLGCRVGTQQLRSWLEPSTDAPTEFDVRAILGVSPSRVPRDRRARVAFVIAVLRDVFPEDRDARDWMNRPRPELGSATPRTCLLRGGPHADAAERSLVLLWNRVFDATEAGARRLVAR